MKIHKRLFRAERVEPVATQPSLPVKDWIVCVPFQHFIEPACEAGLATLERGGIDIMRYSGCSDVPLVRSQMLTSAMKAGKESIMFIDSDVEFPVQAVLNFFTSDVPILAGHYSPKRYGRANGDFFPECKALSFGDHAKDLVPVMGIGAGFLRIKTHVLKTMIEKLPDELPYCEYGGGEHYPFCVPTKIQVADGRWRYLGEDYSFCHRARLAGFEVLADLSVRLYHIGQYRYGWEEMASVPVVTNGDTGEVLPLPLRLSGITVNHRPSCEPDNRSNDVQVHQPPTTNGATNV